MPNPSNRRINLNQDFREFIGLLESESVRYLIAGGYAVGIHGFPRDTGDIILEQTDFSGRKLRSRDRVRTQKIQALTGIDGVNFADCYLRKRKLKRMD